MARRIVHAQFRAAFTERMERGEKTCTSRTYGYLGKVGDIFPNRGSLYEITERERHTLQYVADNLWQQEGAESQADFLHIWQGIHGVFLPGQTVSVTHFRRVPPGTVLRVVEGGVELEGDRPLPEQVRMDGMDWSKVIGALSDD